MQQFVKDLLHYDVDLDVNFYMELTEISQVYIVDVSDISWANNIEFVTSLLGGIKED